LPDSRAVYIGWRGLLEQAGEESDVKVQESAFTQVAALQAGQGGCRVVYINNEPIQLRAAGLDVNVIAVSDYLRWWQMASSPTRRPSKRTRSCVRSLVRACCAFKGRA